MGPTSEGEGKGDRGRKGKGRKGGEGKGERLRGREGKSSIFASRCWQPYLYIVVVDYI